MVLPGAPGQVGGGNPKEEQEAEGAKGPVGSEDAEDRRREAYSPGCGDWISSRFFESIWEPSEEEKVRGYAPSNSLLLPARSAAVKCSMRESLPVSKFVSLSQGGQSNHGELTSGSQISAGLWFLAA